MTQVATLKRDPNLVQSMAIVWTILELSVLKFVHHCTRMFNYIHINSYNWTLNGSHVTILTKQTRINTKFKCRCSSYKNVSCTTTLTTDMVSIIASPKLCNGKKKSKLIVWLWYTSPLHNHLIQIQTSCTTYSLKKFSHIMTFLFCQPFQLLTTNQIRKMHP
jgi:hypothetical protein